MRLLYVAQENNKSIGHARPNALIVCLRGKAIPGIIATDLLREIN